MSEDPADRTDEQWRALLTPEQYRITRRKGTERAFTGAYWKTTADGAYLLPEGVTGEDGRHVCDNAVPNGRIAVLAWHPGYAVPDVQPFVLPDEGEEIDGRVVPMGRLDGDHQSGSQGSGDDVADGGPVDAGDFATSDGAGSPAE